MIVSDIKTSVKRSFGDESGVQVTDADILRWINGGMRQIVMQNESLLETTALAASVANQQDYSFPADLLIFKGVQYKAEGQGSYYKLMGMLLSAFNETIDGWDGTDYAAGRPMFYTVHENEIKLFPIPDTSTANAIKIYYNKKPTEVTADGDTPVLPELYHEALVKYCLQQAYEMDEDFEAAGAKAAELASDVGLLRGREDSKLQQTYPVITVLAEDM